MDGVWPTSALRAAERAFRLLASPPRALMLDGRDLLELRGELLAATTPLEDKDAVWRQLVDRSRRLGDAWTVAAVGMAMPGLRHHSRKLCAGWRQGAEDIDAELVRGFLDGLRTVDTAKPAIAARLVWAARRAGVRLRFAEATVVAGEAVDGWAAAGGCGNPDLVLAEAVTAGVLSRQEAELIGATRLERAPIGRLAATAGVRANTLVVRRLRAERRLVAALHEGRL
jgi:hypothetical protein